MAIKKVQLPDNSTQDINDARVVSDAIVYKGEELGDATYTSGGAVVDLSDYQPLLVSGTSIKTINNQSLLGSGNISISGGSGGGGEENVIEVVKQNGTALTVTDKAVNVTVPTKVSDLTNDSGYTTNTGTVTGVKMNGTTNNPTSGIVDLGTVITSETSLSKGSTSGNGNAVTDISVSGHQITLTKGTTFLTSYTETDPVFTASAAHGITSSDISNWNGKTSNVGTITGITMNGSSKGTSGVVNLGTVVTSETDPVFSASAAAGITSSNISAWNAKQNAITISSSEPTSSDGSNGDIWIVIPS